MKKLIETFGAQFEELHVRSTEFVKTIPQEKLFWKPEAFAETYEPISCGELILRSAGAVEQTFGGITVKLWDDPFEWTLPEELSTNAKILDYLNEVKETRRKGFAYFISDEDLYKEIPAPEKLTMIAELLIETLKRAENSRGRASVVFQMLAEKK